VVTPLVGPLRAVDERRQTAARSVGFGTDGSAVLCRMGAWLGLPAARGATRAARRGTQFKDHRHRSSAGCCFRDIMSPNFPRGHTLQETRGGPPQPLCLVAGSRLAPQTAPRPERGNVQAPPAARLAGQRRQRRDVLARISAGYPVPLPGHSHPHALGGRPSRNRLASGNPWSAGCGETRTSGAEGGPGRRKLRNRAPVRPLPSADLGDMRRPGSVSGAERVKVSGSG
jgi:hypothetical protein